MDWKDVLAILIAYRSEILLALAAIASFTWQWWKKQAIAFMLQMEKEARENLELSGPEKLQAVMQLMNEKLFKGAVPDYILHWLAQKWYEEAVKA